MLRTTAIGLASIMVLGVSVASTAAAMGGRSSGGAIHGANTGPGSMMAVRSNSSPGRFAEHDMGHMRMADHDRDHGRDHDHDRGRHDHDRFRFFPAFAFGVSTYSDVYDPDYGGCWQFHRVLSHGAWRLRRIWVCN